MNFTLRCLLIIIIPVLSVSIQSCEDEPQPEKPTNTNDNTEFIASVSQVWTDTANGTRRVTLANVSGSNQIIGTDEYLGDPGAVNLQGYLNNFAIKYTVIIKYQPPNYTKWYIDYAGTITDTSANHKRMVLYSEIDTLYLKPN